MPDKPATLYTRLGDMTQSLRLLTTSFQGDVQTCYSAGFGRAHAALIPLTASANSRLILSRQPQEGRQFTWAGT